jgi:hypothetical protein
MRIAARHSVLRMELRRVAVVLGGLVLVGSAVIALRLASGTPDANSAASRSRRL